MNPENETNTWPSLRGGNCVSSWSSWWSGGPDLCLLLQRQVVLLHLPPQCEVSYRFREHSRTAAVETLNMERRGKFRNLIFANLRTKSTSANCRRKSLQVATGRFYAEGKTLRLLTSPSSFTEPGCQSGKELQGGKRDHHADTWECLRSRRSLWVVTQPESSEVAFILLSCWSVGGVTLPLKQI